MIPDTPNPVRAIALAGFGDAVCLLSSSAADVQANSPPRPNTQIKFQDPASAEFDAEIALSLAASHWRTAALFLNLTAQCAEAGDLQSAENNRRQAREQFNTATDVFRHFQEARAAAAAAIGAEAFL